MAQWRCWLWYGGRVCASRGSSAEGGRHGGSHSRGGLPGLSVRRCQHETGCARERAWGSAAERRRRHGWRGGGAWLAYLGEMWVALEEGDARPPGKIRQIAKRVSPCNKTSNLQIQKRTSRQQHCNEDPQKPHVVVNTATRTAKSARREGVSRHKLLGCLSPSGLSLGFFLDNRELSVRYQCAQRAP